MAGPSKERHSAETLKFLAERLAKISAAFSSLSEDYDKLVGGPLVVLKDDQRKRALLFLDRFLSESQQALTAHLEETGRYKAAPVVVPAPQVVPSVADPAKPRRRVVRRGEKQTEPR
jgi:hypothetical protein